MESLTHLDQKKMSLIILMQLSLQSGLEKDTRYQEE
jgi:hypothetical protein